MRLESALVALFFDPGSPLVTRPGFDEFESLTFVQMPGRLESFEGMQENHVVDSINLHCYSRGAQDGSIMKIIVAMEINEKIDESHVFRG